MTQPLGFSPVRLASSLWALLRRLGRFYAAALATAVAALFGFAELTEELLQGELQALNRAVTSAMHAEAHPVLDQVALWLSQAGSVVGTAIATAALFALLVARRRYLDASSLLLVVGGGAALVIVLKRIFRQPRPDLFESLAPETTFSYPSGHSLISVALYGFLAALIVLDGPHQPRRWLVAGLVALFPLGVMWSRVYLGVHWISDITAGALVATFWVMVCLMLRRRLSSRFSASSSTGS